MAISHSCDRCGAAMGGAPHADVHGDLGPNVIDPRAIKLRGGERKVDVDLCVDCFLRLKDWISPKIPRPDTSQ
jgi:hypothetical protein